MKKILSIILTLCIMGTACAMPAFAEEVTLVQTNAITIMVDGNEVDCAAYGQLPVIVEGRTLVPLRSVFEALGATVEWNNEQRSVTSVKGDVTITLAVDSKEMVVNGEVKTLDVPACIMNDRTLVPVRAVAEAFGATVEWNNDVRCVVITTVAEETPEDVVKMAYDAMLALNFEECSKCYKNPDAAMGEFAGVSSIYDMVGMVAGGENVTEEQVALIEQFTRSIMTLITYEITGTTVNGDTAEVSVTTYVPNFEGMELDAYLTEEAILMLYMEILAELGYTWEDLSAITDEAEAEMIANALTGGMLEYIAMALEIEAEAAGYIATEGVEQLEKVDGKWLIVTEAE